MQARATEEPVPSITQALRRRYLAHPAHGPLPALLLLLTVVTGLVDAVSILRMGRVFVANMTGNVAFIGFGLAGAAGISVVASLTALAGFVLGASAAGWFPKSWWPDRARLVRTTVVTNLALVLPVVVVAATVGISPGRSETYVLSALLAASMGVQNVTVRRLAVPDLTTTVLTMTLTGLFVDLWKQGWRRPAEGYRVLSVVFLLIGAVLGASLVLSVNAASALGLGALLLATVGLVGHRASPRHVAWAAFPAS